jgi:hypothetical protein
MNTKQIRTTENTNTTKKKIYIYIPSAESFVRAISNGIQLFCDGNIARTMPGDV